MNQYKRTDMVNFANSILSGWGEAMNEAMRPAEGSIRLMQETKTVKMKCVYPSQDDGASYSWVKIDEADDIESYGGTK
jgi:hypothetical protein